MKVLNLGVALIAADVIAVPMFISFGCARNTVVSTENEKFDGNTLSVDGGKNTDITLINTEISDINVLMPEAVGKVS